MTLAWLKRSVPRSLYGRAALILLLPVIALQLVISIAFIQRHYDGVTRAMARTMALDLTFLTTEVNAADGDAGPVIARLATAFDLTIAHPAPPLPAGQGPVFYDLAATALTTTLQDRLPPLRALAFDRLRRVTAWLETDAGMVAVTFDRRRVSASNPHQLLVLMVVFGALMSLIAYLFLRNQLRPITRLAEAAAAFGRGRIVPYSPGGAVEVRAAGTAFVDMRARIERQAQTRTLMLSGVSHDLRTPLTRMQLALSLMNGDEARALQDDVDQMTRMVDSFLDFARDGSSDPVEQTDALALVQSVVAQAGPRVTHGPTEGEPAIVPLRPTALRRAIDNLVGNALRHGARVQVSLAFGEKSLRISVEDDGPGIPAAQRDEAMRPFVRLDPARNQDRGSGVGLGLAIVAEIARAHGGVLRLGESAALGGLRADLVLAR